MKLLFLIGNTAVGKMTVGQELAKRTGLRLFHNHMTIEPVLEIFGTFHNQAVSRLREVIFEEFAATDAYGLIFTMIWDFASQADWDYVAHVREIFESHGAEVYYAELVASQEERLRRNGTENRLKNKASKRDIEFSNQLLIGTDANHRCESLPGEIPFENYIRIDNTHLTPEEAAKKIQEHFQL